MAAMSGARTAMTNVVIAARTKKQQRDALTWATVIAVGLTALVALAPLLVNALRPAAAEDRAAAVLHKSWWEAGVELMASGDRAGWRQPVDADSFQHNTAQARAARWNLADAARRPVRCAVTVAPNERASGLLSHRWYDTIIGHQSATVLGFRDEN